ncbi:hypothetical protein QYE76_034139 [Lolium multiflorum]|uniref:AP2/ERF domain-containing protein n=1 Tax=Lolium multiflorum TaxID=4521 RepID=A0AAD8QYD8_LOLMU|nr:hypothetical protein QYE76_034139 [Lolium multiflorum]
MPRVHYIERRVRAQPHVATASAHSSPGCLHVVEGRPVSVAFECIRAVGSPPRYARWLPPHPRTYNTAEEAARAYDAAAWRFRRPGHDINFPDVESLEEAEFLAPPPCLVTTRTVAGIARCSAGSPSPADEQLMRRWRARSPDAFFANLRAQRRSNRRHRRAVAAFELENSNTTWTKTTLGGMTFGRRQPPTTSRD